MALSTRKWLKTTNLKTGTPPAKHRTTTDQSSGSQTMTAATDLRRTATAILGATVLSAVCVFGAVGPARAEAPAAKAKAAVTVEIPATVRLPILM